MLLNKAQEQLIEVLLEGMPLVHRPFELLGQRLGLSEQECINGVQELVESGVINSMSASFDLRGYGYQSCLVAMNVPPGRVNKSAKAVHDYPGLAYCAQRYDLYNLWLSLYTPPTVNLDHVVDALHLLAESRETLMLPSMNMYKAPTADSSYLVHERMLSLHHHGAMPYERATVSAALNERDVQLIQLLQEDLPLVEMPFTVLAQQAGMQEEELFNWARGMQQSGVLKFFGAMPSENPKLTTLVVVWQVPQEAVEEVAQAMTRFREVLYCDQRPVYESWPYSLFTLIQSPTEQKCVEALARIEAQVGNYTHKNLFRVAEYKNSPITLFDNAHTDWWANVDVSSKQLS